MKVSDLFVKSLENEGVQYVFGVPGEENEDLLFSLEQSSVQFVPTRHEQGAAFMANVWGRVTGRAGVCLATLGPGATNLVTGVADANLDKSPLVALTAQGGLSRLHHESHQNLDIVNMFRPITLWNSAISHPDTVTEVVRKAFKIAESEKPGATHIELSEDVAAASAEEKLDPLSRRRVRRPAPDYKAVAATIELLKSARRPLILAGNGAIRTLASTHLTRLADRYEIPVAATFMGKGALSDRNERSLFAVGLGFRDYVQEAFETTDLIITVGYDIAELPPERWNPYAEKPVVHVDFIPAEVHAHYSPEVEVVGDISGALWELNRGLANEHFEPESSWYPPIRRAILDDIANHALQEGDPFTIPGVLNIVRETLDESGLLISDVGSHKMWIARNFPTYVPNGCIISNGLASMGIALPGGIAASLAHPGRQVVAAMGDGGFLMNSQELETAKRFGVGFTTIVFNDFDYGLISWKQRMSRGRSVFTQLGNPDFKEYAESFGITAYRPENLAELVKAIETSVSSGELSLVEVRVDPSVNYQLLEKLESHWEGQASWSNR